MTTKKQPTNKTKPTTAPTTPRRPKDAPPQAFDIIPRSRVRPSETSRPVITSTQPAVADNTLTPIAPSMQLKHQALTITPPTSMSQDASDDAPTEAGPVLPKEQGVSVSDLLAKKAEKADKIEVTVAPKPEPESKPETPKVAEPPKVEPVDPEPKKATPAEGSLEAALEEDDVTAKPQEHSQALKDAMQELDEDGRPHHDLYGGKPVIVIHKNHGNHSALMWVLWFFLCVGLALLIVNILLDAGVITTNYKVPHTHFINK